MAYGRSVNGRGGELWNRRKPSPVLVSHVLKDLFGTGAQEIGGDGFDETSLFQGTLRFLAGVSSEFRKRLPCALTFPCRVTWQA
jgi:hypothetical protein